MFLTKAAEVSGEHRDSRLKILFTLSWGNSANQLQSVTAFLKSVEEENVMDVSLEISLQAVNIQEVNRSPIGWGKMEFLTVTFKVTFTSYLFNNQKTHYSRILPGCVQTIHSSSGLEGCLPHRGPWYENKCITWIDQFHVPRGFPNIISASSPSTYCQAKPDTDTTYIRTHLGEQKLYPLGSVVELKHLRTPPSPTTCAYNHCRRRQINLRVETHFFVRSTLITYCMLVLPQSLALHSVNANCTSGTPDNQQNMSRWRPILGMCTYSTIKSKNNLGLGPWKMILQMHWN